MNYTADDYTQAMIGLAPQGMAWDWRPGSNMHAVLRALARGYESSDIDAVQLLEGAFPKTATTLLPEWEKTLGLPDDCAIGEMDTIPKRQSAVLSKLLRTGGMSKDYYTGLAVEMGFNITITEFRQARAGLIGCGAAINGEDWPFVWRVNAGETQLNYAVAGRSYCGDPLRSWGDRYFECHFSQISPSHTILQVVYNL
ncbi:YmfQ family protein [Morganella morganii]|uniref:YmfQ family protein n=1 Tax=Morganella morganii TaxID=582 RepID=UPI0032DA073D